MTSLLHSAQPLPQPMPRPFARPCRAGNVWRFDLGQQADFSAEGGPSTGVGVSHVPGAGWIGAGAYAWTSVGFPQTVSKDHSLEYFFTDFDGITVGGNLNSYLQLAPDLNEVRQIEAGVIVDSVSVVMNPARRVKIIISGNGIGIRRFKVRVNDVLKYDKATVALTPNLSDSANVLTRGAYLAVGMLFQAFMIEVLN